MSFISLPLNWYRGHFISLIGNACLNMIIAKLINVLIVVFHGVFKVVLVISTVIDLL